MKGYKKYKTYYNVPLIKSGYNTYNIKGNTKLGKLLNQAKRKFPNCIVWYKILNEKQGIIDIILKEIEQWTHYTKVIKQN